MRRNRSLLVFCLLLAPSALIAQRNPVVAAAREMAAQSGKNLLAAAEAMPADKYSFKPTPAQMSFGELIVHIQGDNRTTCGVLSGTKADPEKKVTSSDTKETLVAALRRSVDFCYAGLKSIDDTKLGDAVTWYGGATSRAMATLGLLTDWADHYGQQAIYLRLNGVLPPTARKK
jgi:uncharacterized damage-inducible protein DinB